MAATDATPVLELRGISKRFGAVQALTDVDFSVYAGEVVGLVGDNGAGKSTLVKCMAGIHPVDSGTIHFQGRQVNINGPKDALALGISTVYQDLALCDNLDVVANLYLGREEMRSIVPGVVETIDEVPMEKRAISVLRGLSVAIPSVRTLVASLSGGQRQSVAVARSVMWKPKLVILDEPTAALGVAQTRQVLDLTRARSCRGCNQPQPRGRLFGGRPDHGAQTGAQRGYVRRTKRNPGASGGSHYRR